MDLQNRIFSPLFEAFCINALFCWTFDMLGNKMPLAWNQLLVGGNLLVAFCDITRGLIPQVHDLS